MIGIATYYQTLVICEIYNSDGALVGADIPVEKVSEFIHTRALFSCIIIASKVFVDEN